ncbi:uncharacterized protein LOC135369044 isoform X2 [Ornithodoros turicata]|uniref:uncharacterized protein LOC135369044 isoform X2 n=1 Tax=Ornithodoros turicata TaxID=34597 RepID=UPI003138BBE5
MSQGNIRRWDGEWKKCIPSIRSRNTKVKCPLYSAHMIWAWKEGLRETPKVERDWKKGPRNMSSGNMSRLRRRLRRNSEIVHQKMPRRPGIGRKKKLRNFALDNSKRLRRRLRRNSEIVHQKMPRRPGIGRKQLRNFALQNSKRLRRRLRRNSEIVHQKMPRRPGIGRKKTPKFCLRQQQEVLFILQAD